MVRLIDINHVGIGIDFSQGQTSELLRWLFTGRNIDKEPYYQLQWPVIMPEGLKTVADWPNITSGLLARGYSETDIRKIIGQNFLRLFREVWS